MPKQSTKQLKIPLPKVPFPKAPLPKIPLPQTPLPPLAPLAPLAPLTKKKKQQQNSLPSLPPLPPLPPLPTPIPKTQHALEKLETNMDVIKNLFKTKETEEQQHPPETKPGPSNLKQPTAHPKEPRMKPEPSITPRIKPHMTPHPKYFKPRQQQPQEEAKEKKSRIRRLHQNLKQKLRQGYLQNKAIQHMKSARILLQQRKIERAKHQSAQALIAYYKLPEHDESLHLQLKSLLKNIERQELQPHHHFHNSSHKMLKLKAEKKEISPESLEAVHDFKQALASQPELTIPKIKEETHALFLPALPAPHEPLLPAYATPQIKKSWFSSLFHHSPKPQIYEPIIKPIQPTIKLSSFPLPSAPLPQAFPAFPAFPQSYHPKQQPPHPQQHQQQAFPMLLRMPPAQPAHPQITSTPLTTPTTPKTETQLPTPAQIAPEAIAPRAIKVETRFEKVHLSKEQKQIMQKLQKLHTIKQQLKDELETIKH